MCGISVPPAVGVPASLTLARGVTVAGGVREFERRQKAINYSPADSRMPSFLLLPLASLIACRLLPSSPSVVPSLSWKDAAGRKCPLFSSCSCP